MFISKQAAAHSVSSPKKNRVRQIFILQLLQEENWGLICQVFQAGATEGSVLCGLIRPIGRAPALQGERWPRKKEPSLPYPLLSVSNLKNKKEKEKKVEE